MKMIDSPTCSLCGNNEESIDNLFWKCPNTQQFLNEVKDKFQEIGVLLNLDECKFILGIYPQNTSDIIQFLAHLSRRLTGELIVYPCSGVRPSSSVVHNFKDLLL